MLSNELAAAHLSAETVYGFIQDGIAADPSILDAALEDLSAHVDRDPASVGYLTPFLYFKGFHALQAHRIAHWLYNQDRKALAYYLQARTSQEYDVDIHPAARMGKGIMIDHASGVVIGETAVVENNVSMLHGVTLGGTGKESGDRHPKIRSCVLLGAGARILGNIEVGVGAKVGASSLVLDSVPPHTTVAGVPAKVIGYTECDNPASQMHHELGCTKPKT